jgi:hypothetical protein
MFYALVPLSVGLLRVSTANASAHAAVPYCASACTTGPTTGAQDVRNTISDLVSGATGGCFLSHQCRRLNISDISAGCVQLQSPIFSHFSHVCRRCRPEQVTCPRVRWRTPTVRGPKLQA